MNKIFAKGATARKTTATRTTASVTREASCAIRNFAIVKIATTTRAHRPHRRNNKQGSRRRLARKNPALRTTEDEGHNFGDAETSTREREPGMSSFPTWRQTNCTGVSAPGTRFLDNDCVLLIAKEGRFRRLDTLLHHVEVGFRHLSLNLAIASASLLVNLLDPFISNDILVAKVPQWLAKIRLEIL